MNSSKKNPQNSEYGRKNVTDFEQQILSIASIGVLITRISDGTILYANKMIASLLGIEDSNSVIGTPVPNFYWDPKDREVLLQRFRADGSVTDHELRARRADGSMIWVSISLQPFAFEGEQVLLSEIIDISGRKQMEQAQKESEERFRSLYNNATIGLYRTTPDGQILMINPTGLRLLGFDTFEELAQRNLEQSGFEEVDARKKFREKLEREGIVEQESVWTKKDGNPIYVRESSTVARDESGNILYYDGSFEDITAYKKAEEALRENQSLYQSLVETSPLSICRKDLEGRFTFANRRFLELSHVTLADLVGKTDLDLHPSELAEKYRRDDLAVMKSGQVQEFIEERSVQDGRHSHVQTIKAPIYDGTGKISGIQISFWDITDRKWAEEALRASENRYQVIFDSSPVMFWLKDTKNNMIQVNQAAAAFENVASKDVDGISCYDLYPREQAEAFYKDDLEVILSGKPKLGIVEKHTSPGTGKTTWVETGKVPIWDGKGEITGVLAFGVDITERQLAEAAVHESEERFRRFTEATVEGLVFHEQGRIFDANPAVLAMFGLSDNEEFFGRNLMEFVVPEFHKTVLQQMQLETVLPYEIQCVRKDGSTFPVETSTRTYKEGGRVIRASSIRDITKRRQAEEAIKQSQTRFQNLVETLGEWVWEVDSKGTYTYISPNIKTLLGYEPEEVVGKTPFDLMPSDEAQRVAGVFGPLLSTQQPLVGLENTNRRKDGSLVVLETNGVPFFDANGQLLGYRGTDRDVTERKQAEEELKRNANFTNALLDAIPTPVFYKDKEGRYQGCNRAFTDIMGVTSEEIQGKTVHQIWPSENAEIYHQKDLELMQKAEHQVYEATTKDKDENIRPVIFAKDVFYDESGNVAGLVGAFLDITERKQAEEAIKQSQTRFQNLVETLGEWVWEVDNKGCYTYISPNIKNLLGYEPEEVLGKTPFDLMPSDEAQRVAGVFVPLLSTQQPLVGLENTNRRKDGSLVVLETNGVPFFDADGQILGYRGTDRDVTERKKAEEALQENQQLLQLVMDNIPQAVFWKDQELTYLGANQSFAEDAGFASPQELVGKHDLDMPWKEQAELYRADDQKILDSGEAKIGYEEQQTGPTGQVTWLRTSKIPMRDPNGQIFAVLGMYEDITEQKQLQQQVQESFERRGYQVQISTEISQEIASATELSDLFSRVVTLTKERLGYYHTQLLRYDTIQDAVVLINGYGKTGQKMLEGGHKMPMGSGLIGTAAESGQTVLRSTLAADPDWHPNPLLPETKGEIAVPIKWQDNVLGVLDVQSDQAGALTEDDRLLLEGLCGQIAIAMQSAELLNAIRENEANLAEALRTARLANWEYDVEKDLFTFNDQFYSIFHTTAEKAGGYQLSSARYAELFVHPDDMGLVGSEIGKSLSSTERVYNTTLDHRIVYEDGGIGYITVKVTVERDEAGKVIRYYGANQDITERKQAELALAEALRAARLANWEYDVEKDLFTFNDQFYSIFHTTAEKAGGYQLSSARYAELFVHPDDIHLVGAEIGKSLSSTERVYNTTIDHRIRYEDGGIGYITVKVTVERDEAGKVTRYYGANQDITERKLAEDAVRRSEQLMRTVIDSTPDWIFIKDQEHRYQLANKGYAEALHIAPEDFIGKNDLDLGFPEELVKGNPEKGIRGFWTDDRLVMDSNETQVYPDDPATIDGMVHNFHTIKVPLRDADQKAWGVLAFARDITDRKQAEEALRRSEQEMAERLEEISRLYRAMSHEGWKTYRETADLPTGFIFDQTGAKPVEGNVLESENFTSIPMKVLGGETVGNLAVANDPRRPMSSEDLDFLQQVSDQVALALEGARFAAQTQSALAQTEKLSEAGLLFTRATDLQEVVRIAAETLGISEINRAALETFNYNSENEVESMDVLANWWNGTGHQTTAVGTRYTPEVLPLIRLFLTPAPIFIKDAFEDERVDGVSLQIIKYLNIHAVAVLPLFLADKQIGVLLLESEEIHEFSQDEIRLFSAMGPQISTVLENRRQFERAQKQAEREGMLNIISQKIQSATTVEAVLQIAARELGHALGAPMTVAQLSMKDRK